MKENLQNTIDSDTLLKKINLEFAKDFNYDVVFAYLFPGTDRINYYSGRVLKVGETVVSTCVFTEDDGGESYVIFPIKNIIHLALEDYKIKSNSKLP